MQGQLISNWETRDELNEMDSQGLLFVQEMDGGGSIVGVVFDEDTGTQ